jgi:hypothetical protein
MVYFLQAGTNGPVKIGYVNGRTRLVNRIEVLQCGNAEKLRLIGVLDPAGYKTESWLHGLFAEERIRGEWFNPHPDILKAANKNHKLNEEIFAAIERYKAARARKPTTASERALRESDLAYLATLSGD